MLNYCNFVKHKYGFIHEDIRNVFYLNHLLYLSLDDVRKHSVESVLSIFNLKSYNPKRDNIKINKILIFSYENSHKDTTCIKNIP